MFSLASTISLKVSAIFPSTPPALTGRRTEKSPTRMAWRALSKSRSAGLPPRPLPVRSPERPVGAVIAGAGPAISALSEKLNAPLVNTLLGVLILVAAIIISAVGDELVIAHPDEHLHLAEVVAVCGGPALYLLGQTLFRLRSGALGGVLGLCWSGDPPALGETPAVRQRATRPDARTHGLGQTKYIDDMYLPGMLAIAQDLADAWIAADECVVAFRHGGYDRARCGRGPPLP